MRSLLIWLLLALPAPAAERIFNFGQYPLDQRPPGFRSTLAGAGAPGDWKVVADPTVPAEPGSTNNAVLAQVAGETIANHFPMLIYDGETYGNFRLATHFKITGGVGEQITGIVFRFQNESNYFVAAANVLRGNLCCYRIEKGEITPLLGAKMPLATGAWHTLELQCEGNRVQFKVDDKEPMKLLIGGPPTGRAGFWTKSDSVVHFADTRITYTPREILAQALVRDALQEYGRLVDLQIFASPTGTNELRVVAGKDAKTLGQPAGKTEQNVLRDGIPYYVKSKGIATVTAPLHDRNGEPIAAVRVVLVAVAGQTQDNAVMRALPIVKRMQGRVRSLEELLQ